MTAPTKAENPIKEAISQLRTASLYATIDDGEGGGFIGSEISGYSEVFEALASALDAIDALLAQRSTTNG